MTLSPASSIAVAGLQEAAYAERVTSLAIVATTEPTAEVICTAPAVTLDGATAVIVEIGMPWWGHSATTQTSFLTIFDALDGGAEAAIERLWDGRAYGASIQCLGFSTSVRLAAPAAGSHVYSLRGHTSGGTFTVTGGAGGAGTDTPIFVRVLTEA